VGLGYALAHRLAVPVPAIEIAQAAANIATANTAAFVIVNAQADKPASMPISLKIKLGDAAVARAQISDA